LSSPPSLRASGPKPGEGWGRFFSPAISAHEGSAKRQSLATTASPDPFEDHSSVGSCHPDDQIIESRVIFPIILKKSAVRAKEKLAHGLLECVHLR
jgi:hypothetical protein